MPAPTRANQTKPPMELEHMLNMHCSSISLSRSDLSRRQPASLLTSFLTSLRYFLGHQMLLHLFSSGPKPSCKNNSPVEGPGPSMVINRSIFSRLDRSFCFERHDLNDLSCNCIHLFRLPFILLLSLLFRYRFCIAHTIFILFPLAILNKTDKLAAERGMAGTV